MNRRDAEAQRGEREIISGWIPFMKMNKLALRGCLDIPSWVAAALPLVCLLTFCLLAGEVRLGLGHWPKRYESYDSAFSHRLLFISGYLLISSAWAPLAWVICILCPGLSPSPALVKIQALVMIGGGYLLLLFIKYSPGNFMGWYFD